LVTSIAPWLSVKNATEALAYYRAAFGAIELERLEDEAGDVVVAQLSIEGADFWIQTDPASSPEALDGRSVRMILTVEDPDAVFARAVAAGATEVAPIYEGHGWRIGRVADPSGHHWEIGRRLAT
jgi:PhnB protein